MPHWQSHWHPAGSLLPSLSTLPFVGLLPLSFLVLGPASLLLRRLAQEFDQRIRLLSPLGQGKGSFSPMVPQCFRRGFELTTTAGSGGLPLAESGG